jgi:prepilin-type processing-associated H-X9-DG protein
MPKCTKCGADSPAGTIFCVQCGAALPDDPGAAPPAGPPVTGPGPQPGSQPGAGTGRSSTGFTGVGGTDPSQWTAIPQAPSRPIWPFLLAGCAVFFCCCPILAALIFPVFAQARIAAQATKSLSDAKQVDAALIGYEVDYDQHYPKFDSPTELARALSKYSNLPNLQALVKSYQWNPELSGKALRELADPSGVWVFYSKEMDAKKRYDIAFADGHVRAVQPSDLDAYTSFHLPSSTGQGATTPPLQQRFNSLPPTNTDSNAGGYGGQTAPPDGTGSTGAAGAGQPQDNGGQSQGDPSQGGAPGDNGSGQPPQDNSGNPPGGNGQG